VTSPLPRPVASHTRTLAVATLVATAAVCATAREPVAATDTSTPPSVLSIERQPLTLDDAIQSALENNENLRVARLEVGSARSTVMGATGTYDPQLTVGIGWSDTKQPVNSAFSGAPVGESAPTHRSASVDATLQQLLPTGGLVTVASGSSRATTDGAFSLLSPAYENQLGLEIRQPLLRDRAIDDVRLTIRLSDAARDQAVGALHREIADTVAAVESAYWTLVAARRAVDVQRDSVELAQRQLDETRSRIESGSVPETEIAQPRAELERRRGDLLATLELASRAETTLKRLILDDDADGWSTSLEPAEDPSVTVAQVDITGAMERALETRPELAEAAANVTGREAETAFANNLLQPALDIVASYRRLGLAGSLNPAGSSLPGVSGDVPPELEGGLGDAFGQLGDGTFHDARIALELRVPIGNREARARAHIAKNTEAEAHVAIAGLRKAIRAEVLDAAAATETAGARIEAARSAREAAEVQLAAEEDRFQVGLSTNFLVLTRQNDLARARLAEIRALTDYRTARTELARATGSLVSDHRIEIE
jgi:outer membrane protein TolC